MFADVKTLQKRFTPKAGPVLNPDRQLCLLRFSPGGQFLVGGGYDATVRRWDTSADSYTEIDPLTGHNGWVQALAFPPAGDRLFSADTWGALCCWDHKAKNPKPTWKVEDAHDGWVRQLAVSPDGNRIATCGRDGAVRLWDGQGKRVREWTAEADWYSVAFAPDGKSLLAGDLKGAVRHWNLADGKEVRRLDAGKLHTLHRIQDLGGVRRLEFDPSGKALAVAGGQPKSGASVQSTPTVLVFDWASGVLRHTLTVGGSNDGFVFDLAWHAEGFLMLVTSGQPGTGKFVFQEPGADKPFFTHTRMANAHALAVHPAGRRLVVAATNAGSNGNGRRLTKDKEYAGNHSPLYAWDLPEAGA